MKDTPALGLTHLADGGSLGDNPPQAQILGEVSRITYMLVEGTLITCRQGENGEITPDKYITDRLICKEQKKTP